MIKIENTGIPSDEQWEVIIRGMRNPMNSWDLSDSYSDGTFDVLGEGCTKGEFHVGKKDLALMEKLEKGDPVHGKFRRMIIIIVYADITAPLYWFKEFDSYKVGTIANSCSIMHKIVDKEFTLDDFSCEHLGVYIPAEKNDGEECFQNLWIDKTFPESIDGLNAARDFYIRTEDPELKKQYWWQMIQLLPSSYNQKRTVMINYEVLHIFTIPGRTINSMSGIFSAIGLRGCRTARLLCDKGRIREIYISYNEKEVRLVGYLLAINNKQLAACASECSMLTEYKALSKPLSRNIPTMYGAVSGRT